MAIALHHTIHGPADGPPIVFLHGFLGRGDDWDETVDALVPAFRCLTVDLPGHGATTVEGGLEEYGLEAAGRSVAERIEGLDLAPCLLVGYSMGGRLALHLAVRYPHLFRKVLIESATPGLESEEERVLRLDHDEALARRLESEPFDDFLRSWYDQPMFENMRSDPDRFDRLLRRRRENDPREMAKSLRAMSTGRQEPLWDRLNDVPVPILALAGRFDAKYCAIAQRMEMRCRSCAMHIVPGCGHNVHFENPAGYTRALKAFLLDGEMPGGEPQPG